MKNPNNKIEVITDVLKKPQYGGLCLTCDHARNCTYPREVDKPVWQCEEFEAYDMLMERTTVEDFLASVSAKTQTTITNNGKEGLKGLCLNCENRKTCTFPKSEGGVWRCEEYL